MRISKILLFATVVLVLWGLITHGTHAGEGDEPHYLTMAHSLAFDRDLDLTNDYANTASLALGDDFAPDEHARPGKDGRLRPVHDVGMPILFAPYYLLAYKAAGFAVAYIPNRFLQRAKLNFTVIRRHLLSLAMIGITALISLSLLKIFTELSNEPVRAMAWSALLILSPPLLSHSFLFFTEILSAFVAVRIFFWLRGNPSGRLAALFAGACTGYLFLVHARNVGLIAALMALAAYRSRRWTNGSRLLVWFTGGAAVLLMARTAVTYHFWGTWVTTPQARLGLGGGWQLFVAESLTRLAGWLFDQEHGLLPYAPVYLLVPLGWLMLWRSDRELCVEISLVIAAYVGVMAVPTLNDHGWRGGWSPAARFLVPVAPFLCVLVFSAVARLRRVPVLILVVVATQVCLDAIVWQHPKLLWNDGTGTSALLNYLSAGSGRLSAWFPSLVAPVGRRTIVAIGTGSIIWVVTTAWLLQRATATTTSTVGS